MSWLFAFSLKFIFKSVNLGQENGRNGGVRQWWAALPTVRSNQAAGEMRGNIKERIYMQSRNCVRVWVAAKLTCHRRAKDVVAMAGGVERKN